MLLAEGSGSGFGIANIREDRRRLPPGDTARAPMLDELSGWEAQLKDVGVMVGG